MVFSVTLRKVKTEIIRLVRRSTMDISSMRASYRSNEDIFSIQSLTFKEPIAQFQSWFTEAAATPGILEPNAMCLATASRDGTPSARYVLLKGYGKDGFKFFTNFTSRKAQELSSNPKAALVFYWEPLRRSVRIEGVVDRLLNTESEAYFKSRPIDSQLGAIISPQSQPIVSKEVLTTKQKQLREDFEKGIPINRPEHWGGYIVKPHSIEFWQGQTDRMHDRIRFRRKIESDEVDGILLHEGDDGWCYECLAP